MRIAVRSSAVDGLEVVNGKQHWMSWTVIEWACGLIRKWKEGNTYFVWILSSDMRASRMMGDKGASFKATPMRSARLVPKGTSLFSKTSFFVVVRPVRAAKFTVRRRWRVWKENLGWR